METYRKSAWTIANRKTGEIHIRPVSNLPPVFDSRVLARQWIRGCEKEFRIVKMFVTIEQTVPALKRAK